MKKIFCLALLLFVGCKDEDLRTSVSTRVVDARARQEKNVTTQEVSDAKFETLSNQVAELALQLAAANRQLKTHTTQISDTTINISFKANQQFVYDKQNNRRFPLVALQDNGRAVVDAGYGRFAAYSAFALGKTNAFPTATVFYYESYDCSGNPLISTSGEVHYNYMYSAGDGKQVAFIEPDAQSVNRTANSTLLSTQFGGTDCRQNTVTLNFYDATVTDTTSYVFPAPVTIGI